MQKCIEKLPSAQVDLSGFCDRLWRGAYASGYERCRQDAIDLVQEKLNRYLKYVGSTEDTERWAYARGLLQDIVNSIRDKHKTKSAQPDLLEDGTLMITVPNGMLGDVKRVLVDEVGTKNCKVMYQDETERKKGEWIPTRIAKPLKAGQYLVTKQQKTGVCQIATAHYNPSFDEWSGNGNFTKVLAWQQLPTPYIQE